jgi:malonyl-CoA decarboxylase
MSPGGTAKLVELRRVLLQGLPQHPAWHAMDADLLHLLRSWFNRGFLRLERIDWHTSALVLEKLIAYEAVHAIQGWPDLRRRLQADRRCFAFFHPSLPDEPLIFIEVALTRRISAEVQSLLAPDALVSDPRQARCAIFYSITNCQEGLRGISFGNFLIKQVAEELKQEFPRLRAFATLSPIPGFRAWLDRVRARPSAGAAGKSKLALLSGLDAPAWQEAEDAPLRHLLSSLCAYYLLHAKQGRDPLDPVARFHLCNGASLERLNSMGDRSAHGIERAAGMMVNYLYRLDHVERNHERFANEHVVVAARRIHRLARECPLAGDASEAPVR